MEMVFGTGVQWQLSYTGKIQVTPKKKVREPKELGCLWVSPSCVERDEELENWGLRKASPPTNKLFATEPEAAEAF
ncbi:hypothetical protein GBA52_021318 [Prunus armeniaca]|nr:hypothetical protein GBA52_021318 [Prunus armeniaca]